MGKKKRLFEKQTTLEERERVSQAVDTILGRPTPTHHRHQDYIRVSDAARPSTISHELVRHIKRGASLEDISDYRHEVLKAVLSYLKVPERSSMTRKIEMADALIKFVERGDYDNRPETKKPVKQAPAQGIHEESPVTSFKPDKKKKGNKKKKKKKKDTQSSTKLPSWLQH